MNARRLPGPVLALTPGDVRAGGAAELLQRARAATEAGLDSILLREPGLSDRALLALARALRDLLGPAGWLGLHDRLHLAAAARADAVHLGHRSLSIRMASEIRDEATALGFSAHAADDPESWRGADYLLFGPVFPTPSKAGLLAPTGVAGLVRAVRSAPAPVWALGGLDAARVPETLASGCRGIAVRAALLGSAEPADAFRRLCAARRSSGPDSRGGGPDSRGGGPADRGSAARIR